MSAVARAYAVARREFCAMQGCSPAEFDYQVAKDAGFVNDAAAWLSAAARLVSVARSVDGLARRLERVASWPSQP